MTEENTVTVELSKGEKAVVDAIAQGDSIIGITVTE